jgi:glycosyltransferase involved in cell wall biosynthesis
MKISIITVVRNNINSIKDTINSVLSQSYKNIEYIIIDGASNDGTTQVLHAYANRIDKIISEADDGIYDAMNKGIKLASGDVIGFLHSDDVYADTSVIGRVASEFYEDPTLDACYADLIYTDKYLIKNIRYWKSNNFIYGSFSRGWSPPHPTFFVHKRVYDKFGKFDLKYKIASDIELMIRFLQVKKINVKYIPQLWIKMRIGGISNRSLRNRIMLNNEILDALESHKLSSNYFVFFSYKIIDRFRQILQRNNKQLSTS